MSRVMPTKPGWWWANVYGLEQIVLVAQDMGVSAVGLNRFIVSDPAIEWLAPVPSAEAVQALVSAAQRVADADDEARDALKNLGVRDVGGESLTEDLRNAIAGMTGGEGGVMGPWEFACKWYRESEIEHSLKIGDVTTRIPSPADSEKFAEWLTHEYRLAMSKGIEIGRNWDKHKDSDHA